MASASSTNLQPNAQTVADVVGRSRVAQRYIENWSQADADQAVAAAGWHCYHEETALHLNELAVAETRYGKIDDALTRYKARILGVMRDLDGISTVGLIETDSTRGIVKFAKPIGLIGVLTPSTAPAAAVVVNALSMLKTRNAIIFCPNPRAKRTVQATVDIIRSALTQVGGPADAIQCIQEPSRERSIELMECVDLIVASGGQGTVRRALTSGTPAFGGGTGNSVVIVDETADVSVAARMIIDGKSFDNGTSCSSESSIVVAKCVVDRLVEALTNYGAHLCNTPDLIRLRKVIWPCGPSISSKIIGQDAITIAGLAEIAVPAETRILIGFPEGQAGSDLMSYEKLSPVLALWTYEEPFENAIDIVEKLVRCSGHGHSCAIHTHMREHIYRLADRVKVSRIMVNQSTCFGNSGSFNNGMPFSCTLSCGSWAKTISNENIHWRHFLNYTWVSDAITGTPPDPQRFFARHWAKFGTMGSKEWRHTSGRDT